MAVFGETSTFTMGLPASGQILAFIGVAEPASGVINAFIPTPLSSQINAFIQLPLESQINGFMNGLASGDSQINGFMQGIIEQNASISGFMNADIAKASGVINAFMRGQGTESSIGAFILNYGDNHIKGYLAQLDPLSKINAFLPSVATAITESINAFIDLPFGGESAKTINAFIEGFDFVHGFIFGGSGVKIPPASSINAFIFRPEIVENEDITVSAFIEVIENDFQIRGFLQGTTESSGTINGFMRVTNNISQIRGLISKPGLAQSNEFFNAFMLGLDDTQFINGFIHLPNATKVQILGFMNALDSSNITVNGFVTPGSGATGSISAFIKNEGSTSTINAFIQAPEGFPASRIKGLEIGWPGTHPPSPLA